MIRPNVASLEDSGERKLVEVMTICCCAGVLVMPGLHADERRGQSNRVAVDQAGAAGGDEVSLI